MILDVFIFSIICIPINIFLKNKFYSKYFKRYFLIALFLNFLALFLGSKLQYQIELVLNYDLRTN